MCISSMLILLPLLASACAASAGPEDRWLNYPGDGYEDLTCDSFYVRITSGTKLVLREPADLWCSLTLSADPGVSIDVDCVRFDMRCASGNYLKFTAPDGKGAYEEKKYCDVGAVKETFQARPEKIFIYMDISKRDFKGKMTCSITGGGTKYYPGLFNSSTCGTHQGHGTNRIVYGKVPDWLDFSWMAYMKSDTGRTCGGTVIKQQWVLTAAHCLSGAKSVGLCFGNPNPDSCLERRTSKRFFPHADFDSATLANDLALIKLTPGLVFDGGDIGAVCLPATRHDGASFSSQPLDVVGWGLVDSRVGSKRMKRAEMVAAADSGECGSGGKTICLYPKDLRAGRPCVGDDGGFVGARREKDKVAFQHGVVSRMDVISTDDGSQTFCSGPVLATKVASYLDWIKSTVENN